MSRLQHAFGTAKAIYTKSRNAGLDPDAAFGRVVGRLTALYPDLGALRIREIATLALV